MPSTRKKTRRKTSIAKSKWLIVWWTHTGVATEDGSTMRPTFAIFKKKDLADSGARVRNALLIEFKGDIKTVVDYKYLDKDANPMPGEQRDLEGGFRVLPFIRKRPEAL